MEVQPRFQDPEKLSLSPEQRCPFNRGNKYKDLYKNIFSLTKLWRGPLNRSVLKERFHCICMVFDWYIHHCPSPLTIKKIQINYLFFQTQSLKIKYKWAKLLVIKRLFDGVILSRD